MTGRDRYRALVAVATAAIFTVPGTMVRAGSATVAQRAATADGSASPAACSLLPDSEIQNAIGAHDPGAHSLQYGPDSCRWMGTSAPPKAPDGWRDRIEVGVFDASNPLQASFRRDAQGDPVDGLGDGALYDRTEGQLWFPCGHNGFCVIEAATASGKTRQALAERLARIVRERLR